MPSRLKFAVIVPAYNAAATIERCLSSVVNSTRPPDFLIVYDDGSTDDTANIADRYASVVIRGITSKLGPAIGRNIAASKTEADVLVFVDADVQIHPDAFERLENTFLEEPEAVAAFGSYDDAPDSRNIAALYANLRHHYYHQTGKREATTFWSGFGAIRRDAFIAVGGFNTEFSEPSIEDIDLGARIRRNYGKILLVPEAMAKHCKDWGIVQLLYTDIFCRALPWSKMIVSGQSMGADLNTSTKERIISALAHVLWIVGLFSLASPAATPFFVTGIGFFVGLNRKFYSLLFRKGGVILLLSGIVLHWLYYLYASAVFGIVCIAHYAPPIAKPSLIQKRGGD